MADLMPDNAEVLGQAALIAFILSREAARVQDGRFVLLEEQDPALCDHDFLRLARTFLERAHAQGVIGRFQLEAAIQAVHADRISTHVTNWDALVQLHLGLSRIAPTIGATVGFAAAVGKSVGPAEGLVVLNAIEAKTSVGFTPAEATRAFFLKELGQINEAAAAYDRAIALTPEAPLRQYLQDQRVLLKERSA